MSCLDTLQHKAIWLRAGLGFLLEVEVSQTYHRFLSVCWARKPLIHWFSCN